MDSLRPAVLLMFALLPADGGATATSQKKAVFFSGFASLSMQIFLSLLRAWVFSRIPRFLPQRRHCPLLP